MQLTKSVEGVYVINDAYNASPDSMRAAFRLLRSLVEAATGPLPYWGRWRSLAKISDQEHRSLGLLLVRYNIDKLVVVGDDAKILHLFSHC